MARISRVDTRFIVDSLTETEGYQGTGNSFIAQLRPARAADHPQNAIFGAASPLGMIRMTLTAEDAGRFFEVGATYEVTFKRWRQAPRDSLSMGEPGKPGAPGPGSRPSEMEDAA